jgi:hypothetical protein
MCCSCNVGVTVIIGGRTAKKTDYVHPMEFQYVDKMASNLDKTLISLKIDLVIHTAGTHLYVFQSTIMITLLTPTRTL